jgi:hypothetical protein
MIHKFNLIFIFIFLISIGFIDAVGTYPNLDPNIILYYHFNNQSAYGENDTYVYDFSGNGNNGTIFKAIYNNTGGYLNDGSFIFNGSQYVTTTSLNYNFSQGLTIMAWIKTNKLISDDGEIISRYVSQNGNRSWSLYINDGKLTFAGSIDGITVVTEIGNTFINDSNWHFVSGVWNGSELRVFIDGLLDSVIGTALNSIVNPPNLKIDIARARRSPYFNGSIDEPIVFNKSMTDLQIWDYYNIYHGCFIPIDSMEVNGNVNFCNGIYNLNTSTININVDNTILDCNGSEIYGNYTLTENTTQSEGMHIINNNNITLKNCYFHNFYRNVKLSNSNNITVLNNTFGFAKQPLYLDNNGTGMNISYNNFNDVSDVNGYNLYFSLDEGYDFNNFYVSNNNFYACNSFCVRINGLNNSIFNNNSFGVYNAYQITDSDNINITNHYFAYGNDTYRIYSNDASINVYNNVFFGGNTTYFTILTDTTARNSRIFNNVFMNDTKVSFPVNVKGTSILVYNNNFSYLDGAIRLRSCSNCEVYGNIINFSINNNDAYGTGILQEFYPSINNSIHDNIIDNTGSWGIIIRQSNGTSIYNNKINTISRSDLQILPTKDYGEPRGGIAILELYKSWSGDVSNTESDNRTNKMAGYNSTNINIFNNTYGTNIEVYFMNRGGIFNITNQDLTSLNWWFRSFQFDYWEDRTDLYINNNFDNLTSKLSDGSIGLILQQNFRNKNKWNFTINKNNEYYQNNNNSIQGGLRFFNKSLALFTNGTSICNGSNSNLALNTGNINITLNPDERCYILDNFNLTEGITREYNPFNLTSNSLVIGLVSDIRTITIKNDLLDTITLPVYLNPITCPDSLTLNSNSISKSCTSNSISNLTLDLLPGINTITLTYIHSLPPPTSSVSLGGPSSNSNISLENKTQESQNNKYNYIKDKITWIKNIDTKTLLIIIGVIIFFIFIFIIVILTASKK